MSKNVIVLRQWGKCRGISYSVRLKRGAALNPATLFTPSLEKPLAMRKGLFT